ncbi:MAG: sugar ABC transporter permease [Spirochaetes bacterium]|nr:sugar ABC transporter permease [Spirochaetota bacterium]
MAPKGFGLIKSRSSINLQFFMKIMVLIVCALGFEVFTKGIFLSPRNITLLLRQTAINGVLATGMVFVIVSGNIDLSIGSGVALSGATLAILETWHRWSTTQAVIVVICIGLLMGVFNGFWTVRGVPSFVATLGSMLILRGLALIFTKGISIAPLNVSTKMIGQGFIGKTASMIIFIAIYVIYLAFWIYRKRMARGNEKLETKKKPLIQLALFTLLILVMIYVVYGYKGIPIPVLLMIALMLVMWFVARYTAFGRYIYAVGGNMQASRYSGINVQAVTFFVFLIMGGLTSVGGILLSARLDGAMPVMGYFMELDAIAAAFIGGCSMSGGVGSIWGALFGALFMATLDNGMSLMNISSFVQYVVKGIIIILAVFSDVSTKSRA